MKQARLSKINLRDISYMQNLDLKSYMFAFVFMRIRYGTGEGTLRKKKEILT